MRKKSDIEMQRARISKVSRTLIRLKHSLAADVEINSTLPDTLAEFDKSIQSGEMLSLTADLADLLNEE